MRPPRPTRAPRSRCPPGSCDAHFHVFEPGYPHVAGAAVHVPRRDPGAVPRGSPSVLGIERMVLVQPTYYGTDNSLTLDVAAPRRRRGAARWSGSRRTSTTPSSTACTTLGVRAIRLDLFARAELPTAEIIDYIRRMAAPDRAARLAPAVLHTRARSCGTCCRSSPTSTTPSSSTTWAT